MFTAYDPAVDAGGTSTIWKSDGTAGGTVRIGQFPSGVGNVTQLAPAGGRLFAVNGSPDGRLWVLDAGASVARIVHDINPLGGSVTSSLTPLGDIVLFSADDGTTGEELWRSDGTAAGTRLVLDIQPTSYNRQYWTPPARTTAPIAGMMVFLPKDPDSLSGSQPADFVVFNGRLAFTAFDTIHGRQVWTSDGTAAGTWRVSDIEPMPARWGLDPSLSLTAVGRQLYFSQASVPVSQWPLLSTTAGVGLSSRKSLWRTDGSPDSAVKVAGAEIVDDGSHWSSFSGTLYVPEPRRLLAGLGSSLIFSGSDAGLNSEPWKLDPADKTRSVT
jgi:ELWxxDGT repeat protein